MGEKLLVISSNENHYQLISGKLEKSILSLDVKHIAEAGALKTALKQNHWDAIISSTDLDHYDWQQILKLVHRYQNESSISFLLDDFDEQIAISILEAGGDDYILTTELDRLIPSIKRGLKITELRRKYSYEKRAKNRLQGIVQKSTTEVYIVNSDSLKYEYVNPAALQNLGYSEDEIYNLSAMEVNPDQNTETVKEIIQPLISGEKEKIIVHTKHQRKDGSTYPAESHVQLMSQDEKEFFATMSFDVSDRQKTMEILTKQRDITQKLRTENRFKTNFMAKMSHELRTSLDSIVLFSQLLSKNSEGNLNARELDYSNAIFNLSSGIHEMINEVLDYSSLESENIELQLKNVNINRLCEKIRLMYLPLANEKQLNFNCRNSQSAVSSIITDQVKLEQILKNLLSNAFKFTETGGITFNIYKPSRQKLHEDKIGHDAIAIEIEDTGIGIPQEKQSHIFESFRQADSSIRSQYGGTGLGLSISQELAELLGGKITLKSEETSGSKFTVYLPLVHRKADGQKSAKTQNGTKSHPKTGPGNQLIKGTILLVDDSSIHNIALKEYLSYKVENCITAASIDEAHEALKNNEINCVILDLNIAGNSGFEILQQINEQKNDLPVIIYTGETLTPDKETKLKQYARDVVQKNVNSYKILENKITSFLMN